MNPTNCQPEEMIVMEPAGITELVRGTDQHLVSLFGNVVTRQDVALDLGKIERIDAAGIAALITLYSDALHAGHAFSVCNPSAHVNEILSLVGLAPILISQDAAPARSLCGQRSCAAA